ncbi:beta-galactosidase [Nakamurella flavida]
MQVHFVDKQIRLDGRPVMVLAGEIHYFRLDRADWSDRLDLLVAAGADTVASYIPWVVHELPDGTLDLTGRTRPELDLGAFVDLAAAKGLAFLARPGPFTMAELRHEGVPGRVAVEHPEIRPVGWDGAPAPTSTLDYLAPAFLAETRSWYAAVGAVLAPRMAGVGGPVTLVQLDNEIGMLAWVSNTPDLTEHLLADLHTWLEDRYGPDGLVLRYPGAPLVLTDDPVGWASLVRSPQLQSSGALRHDLSTFLRGRFARYVDALAGFATESGFGGVPFLINVHGTEAGGAASFPIGIAQLLETWRGRADRTAGSDHYVGTLTWASAAELYLVHAFLDATLDAGQPLTSLEFEVGTGDYGGDEGAFTDPTSVVLKTRLLLSQGTRLFNAYLFAGGENFLDERVDDRGTHRFGITGQRHGSAAPVDPDGRPGPAYASTREALQVARAHERWAATWQPEFDDVTVGFVPDHYATEYTYRGNAVMPELTDDLRHARGGGPGSVLARALLGAGIRYCAVDLGGAGALGGVVVLGSPSVLGAALQRRLVEHVTAGGGLLLVGSLPTRDDDGASCTIFADALGLRAGETLTGADLPFASLVGAGWAAHRPEVRVGRMQVLDVPAGEVLLRDAMSGRPVAAHVRLGAGQAVVIAADVALPPEFLGEIIGRLGGRPGLRIERDTPGVLATTTRTPDGDRFLHVMTVTGLTSTVSFTLDGRPLFDGDTVELAPRTGLILPVDVGMAGRRVAATAEIVSLDGDVLTLRAAGPGRAVWIDGCRRDLGGPGDQAVALTG